MNSGMKKRDFFQKLRKKSRMKGQKFRSKTTLEESLRNLNSYNGGFG